MCSHSIFILFEGKVLTKLDSDSVSNFVNSVRGTHNAEVQNSYATKNFSKLIGNQPRKLASESDYFKNVHEVIQEAASQFLLGKSRSQSKYSANNPGWKDEKATANLFEAKFVLDDENTLFEVKITFNGQAAVCKFESSDVSDEMEIQYVVYDFDEMLVRIKLFVEDWTFRFLDKMDQTVVKIASVANDIQELINKDFKESENLLYGRILSDHAQNTQRLSQLSVSRDSVNEKELKTAQIELGNYESELQKISTENSKEKSKTIEKSREFSDDKFRQLKGKIEFTKLKIEELQKELKKVKSRNLRDERIIPPLRATRNTPPQSKSEESNLDSQLGLSFLEKTEKILNQVQIFEQPLSANDLIFALNKLTGQRPIFSKGNDWFESTSSKAADRFLVNSANEILEDPITGSPMEKVKAIVGRYKAKYPQTADKKADILYFNSDVGLKNGLQTDYVHMLMIHIDDQVHVYAENSMFKFNYRVSAVTKRILIKNIEKILWDFRFLGYIAKKFLEMDVQKTSIQSRKSAFDSGNAKFAIFRKKASLLDELKPGKSGKELFDIKFDEATGTDKNPLPNSFPDSQQLILNIDTKGCSLKIKKDYPVFSMFNTWFMVETMLKTWSSIFVRQFKSMRTTEQSHVNIDMVNPFVDYHESPQATEHDFSSFKVNRVFSFPSIRTVPIMRLLSLPRGRILTNKKGSKPNTQTNKPVNSIPAKNQPSVSQKSGSGQVVSEQSKTQSGGKTNQNSEKSVSSGGNEKNNAPNISTKKDRPYIVKFDYIFYTFQLKFSAVPAPLDDGKIMNSADYVRSTRKQGDPCDTIIGWKIAQKYKTDINRLNIRNTRIVL